MLRIVNPYPGFENGFYKPFVENDAKLFFGRSQEIATLKLKLRQRKLVTVVSNPKSGVTSLLRAGVIPNLRNQPFDGLNGKHWKCIYFNPGENPILSLAQAIVNPYNKLSDKLKPSMEEDVYNRLQKNDYGLLRVFEQIIGDKSFNVVIIIDDFFEVWDRIVDAKVRRLFLNLLHKTLIDKTLPVYYIFSVKQDEFLRQELKEHAKLYKRISVGLFKVKFLSKDALKKAIEMPAQFGNSKVDDELSKELLFQLLQDTDQLRKLQLLMSRTWLEWKRNHKSKIIGKEHYFKAIGQKHKAVASGLKRNKGISLGNIDDRSSSNMSMSDLSKWDYQKLNDDEKMMFKLMIPQLLEKKNGTLKSRPIEIKRICEILDINTEDLGYLATKIPTIIAMDQRKVSLHDVSMFNDWDEVHTWVDAETKLKEKFSELADAAILYYIDGIDIKSVISRAQFKEIFEWYDPGLLTPAWAMHQHKNFELGLDFIEKLQEVYGKIKPKKSSTRSKIRLNKEPIKVGNAPHSKISIGGSKAEESSEEMDEAKLEAMKILGLAEESTGTTEDVPKTSNSKLSIKPKVKKSAPNDDIEGEQDAAISSGKLKISKPKLSIRKAVTETVDPEITTSEPEEIQKTAAPAKPKLTLRKKIKTEAQEVKEEPKELVKKPKPQKKIVIKKTNESK